MCINTSVYNQILPSAQPKVCVARSSCHGAGIMKLQFDPCLAQWVKDPALP